MRRSNQDAFTVDNDLGLWVVADGMGGHAGGDVASQLAVESVTTSVRTAAANPAAAPSEQRNDEALLREALHKGHQDILKHAAQHPELTGMGTTIVVVRVVPSPTLHATVAHVGDSRAYLFRDGSLSLLTQDHSLIEEYVRRGMIRREQAFRHPLGHVLSRALGLERAAKPDIAVHPLRPDDLLLLCTDGLTKMLDDQQIEAVLTAGDRSLEARCQALVDEALRLGGEDNVTVVLCSSATRW